MGTIRKATKYDLHILASLACILWDNHTIEELKCEFHKIMDKKSTAFFLIFKNEQAIGFAQCQLRHDYVEGAGSGPVGYLEGIFMKDEYRHKGYGKKLLQECEKWALENGCREIASDCELVNETSLKFHLNMGFTEANRIICFIKKLQKNN